jgi:DNA-binding Lrp family transcriptional regulator
VVTAYILIQTEVGKAAKVAKDTLDITGVQQAQAVTGPYDVIVRAEAHNIDELDLPSGTPLALLDHRLVPADEESSNPVDRR